ncbi:hypothetical protein FFWV33_15930 [Flavobacterium faecale]|uniref:Uncharacterized protein n=1 Tax=Flavobacterium faecale TaxID=1355330 RepID=A0A2S1LGS7_9FLAO|nr:hypothetical protein [Flavobacterium faecale]AWG22908.1 hypothetical protein FFWV33_15930 [Flavobacterium faecale]
MKNSEPFTILIDCYSIECANLYEVVKNLFKYPCIQKDHNLQSFVYASAFGYICREYLSRIEQKDPYDCDLDLLLNSIDYYGGSFKSEDFNTFKEGLSTETLAIDPKLFVDLVWGVLNDYKKIITNDLKKLLLTDENIERFMASVLGFSDEYFSIQLERIEEEEEEEEEEEIDQSEDIDDILEFI